jgi:hypothetical protein
VTVGARTKRSPRAKAKPAPRKKPGPKPPRPEKVAQILVDAELYGDAYAAERAGLTTRTVERYRAAYATDPIVSGLVDEKLTRLTTGWEKQLRAVQKELTLLVLEGARSRDASLRDRTDALRRVSELGISKQLLGPDDDERADDHQRRDPQSPRGPGAGAEAAREGRGPQEGRGRSRGEVEED